MIIKIKAEDLTKVLSKIKYIAKSDKNRPELGSGLFETGCNGITTISVSSLVDSAIVSISAEIIQDGKCMIDIAQLISILSTMSGEVEIEYNPDNSVVWIKNKKTKCRLNSLDVKKFLPRINISDVESDFIISSKDLKEGLQKTIKFVDSNSNAIMSGVCVNVQNNLVKFIATNGSYMSIAVRSVKDEEFGRSFNFVLPRASVANILPMLNGNEDVYLKFNSSRCCFEFSQVLYCTGLLEGKYPNCEGFIAKEYDVDFSVNKSDLKRVLERISIVETKNDKHRVFFTVKGVLATIEAKDYKCNDVLELVEKNGNDISFVLNRLFLEDVISVLQVENMRFKMTSSRSPIILPDVGDTYLIMPMT